MREKERMIKRGRNEGNNRQKQKRGRRKTKSYNKEVSHIKAKAKGG